MKVAKAIAETNRPFHCTFGYLERLAPVHICILFPLFYPRSSFHPNGPALQLLWPSLMLGYAYHVVIGDRLYEKAYEIAAAYAS